MSFYQRLNDLAHRAGLHVSRRASAADLLAFISHLTNLGLRIDVVYDVGAFEGRWSQEVSQRLRGAQFFMFEANDCHNELLTNTGFWFTNAVLSDSNREVDFYSLGGNGDSYYRETSSKFDDTSIRRVSTQTLDQIVIAHSLPSPDLIKVDTQGSELDVLLGARASLDHASVVLLECPVAAYNSGAPKFDDYVAFMHNKGFTPVAVTEIHFILGALVQIDLAFMRVDVFRRLYPDGVHLEFLPSAR
jgi:FkbM family methyltransferase